MLMGFLSSKLPQDALPLRGRAVNTGKTKLEFAYLSIYAIILPADKNGLSVSCP